MAGYTINDKWYSEKKKNIEEEAERLVSAAAKIVRAEIREKYIIPTNEDIANANVIGMDTMASASIPGNSYLCNLRRTALVIQLYSLQDQIYYNPYTIWHWC